MNGLLPRSTPDSPLFLASIMERWLSLRPNADATAHFPSSVGILIEPYAGRQVAASPDSSFLCWFTPIASTDPFLVKQASEKIL